MSRVGIIGAGPGGLTAAARLVEAGLEVEIFEASDRLGGMSRSLSLWGRQLDLSAHIFLSHDRFVNDLWQQMAGQVIHLPLRRGIFNGRNIAAYPLTPIRLARSLSTADLVRCALGLVAGQLKRPWTAPPCNAEEWMLDAYGRRLHELFLRDYAEKLWGLPCDQIDAQFARFLFHSAADSQRGDQNFSYPLQGTGSVWERLAAVLEEAGVTIHRSTPISEIQVSQGRLTGLVADNRTHPFDHVLSTMPLGRLGRMLAPTAPEVEAAAAVLVARSTVLVYLLASEDERNQLNWISVYPSSYRVGRLTDFGCWTDQNDGNTVYCLEYWCDRGDPLWNESDEDLATLATAELSRSGLVGDVCVLDSHVERLSNTHPVFTLGFQNAIDTITRAVDAVTGISTLGRLGSHGVLGMGETMEAARRAADRVIGDVLGQKASGADHLG